MIDLHLHTTASDGRCTPRELVDRAAAARLSVIAVTDHDTTAGIADARAHAGRHGMEVVSGIEITAIEDGLDVHVLGYFLQPSDPALQTFLEGQRTARAARLEAIAGRLAALGMPIDVQPLLQAAGKTSRSLGRPLIAREMIAAGYVADTREAFDEWLGRGAPAFVPRSGVPAEVVIEVIHAAGGLASLAHPGRTRIDGRIAPLRDAGLDALEVFHTDHDDRLRERYARLADELGLLVTGGSDYHGDPSRGFEPGAATLPPDRWRRLECARRDVR